MLEEVICVCVYVQTMEGQQARGPVSSELAAMFTWAVLPTLRKHYYDPTVPGLGWWDYVNTCAGLAREMGIPDQDRHKVTLPFYISYDWDPRHTWVRGFIANPGRDDDTRNACDDAVFREHQVSTARAQPTAAASNLMESLQAEGRDDHRQKVRRMIEADSATTSRAQTRQAFRRDANLDFVLQARFNKSRDDKRFLTVLPEQFMPLSEVSPDIHSPVEHMVKTLKGYIREKMLDRDLNDASLWDGKTYQDFIDEAVAVRGNGASGRDHITGSVRKQNIICKILAAEKGQQFDVMHCFGKPGADRTQRHTVEGTAGGWIKDTKWT